jgi:hypothetical protein
MITCQRCNHIFQKPTDGMKKFAIIVEGKRVLEECHMCPPLDQRKPIPKERPVYKDPEPANGQGGCGSGGCGGCGD